jgi:hypothetical protein
MMHLGKRTDNMNHSGYLLAELTNTKLLPCEHAKATTTMLCVAIMLCVATVRQRHTQGPFLVASMSAIKAWYRALDGVR